MFGGLWLWKFLSSGMPLSIVTKKVTIYWDLWGPWLRKLLFSAIFWVLWQRNLLSSAMFRGMWLWKCLSSGMPLSIVTKKVTIYWDLWGLWLRKLLFSTMFQGMWLCKLVFCDVLSFVIMQVSIFYDILRVVTVVPCILAEMRQHLELFAVLFLSVDMKASHSSERSYLLLLIKRYNLYKDLACSTPFFQLSLFCATFFQFLMFMLFVSSKTSYSQRVLGFPIGLLHMGFHLLIFCTILSSAMRSTRPNKFNLCFLTFWRLMSTIVVVPHR